MFYGAKRLKPRRFTAKNVFRRELWVKFPIQNFNIREFPQMRVYNAGRPLADEKTPVPAGNKGSKATSRGGFALSEVGQFVHAIFPKGDAKCFYRTNRALRISRRANERA